MIVKIFKPGPKFTAVRYNTDKVDRNKGELMKTHNFGPLQWLGNMKPQDYVNYLTLLSSLNSNVKLPQFHAVISAQGISYDKYELTHIAEKWLIEMGYGKQPYLVIFHKDTGNNHVHIVTARVEAEGRKIDSAFEGVRAVNNLDKVLGYSYGLEYNFSTRAQFYMLLEQNGYKGKDVRDSVLQKKISGFRPDKERASELRERIVTNQLTGIELIFHSAEGKAPYGYTIIDHEQKNVFKGSEVLPLRELMFSQFYSDISPGIAVYEAPVIGVIIADDVDDELINGRKRRRQKKGRNN